MLKIEVDIKNCQQVPSHAKHFDSQWVIECFSRYQKHLYLYGKVPRIALRLMYVTIAKKARN